MNEKYNAMETDMCIQLLYYEDIYIWWVVWMVLYGGWSHKQVLARMKNYQILSQQHRLHIYFPKLHIFISLNEMNST